MGKVSHVYSKKHNSFIHFASPALILLFSIFLKWSTSLNSFSGKGVEPMHGDFEAQRHWIEITSNLPVNQWYTYKTEYWGLDYPPLTAYHSLLLSKFSSNKTNFELDKSRGLETNQVILFMRLTSIFSDLILYSVSLLVFSVYFVTKFDKVHEKSILLPLLPATLMIMEESFVGVLFNNVAMFRQIFPQLGCDHHLKANRVAGKYDRKKNN
ncbi:Glucosyltransferase-like protein [Lobulomyces angularis]|nr:Glucosyltransferase-like protein [Lobulomyces angularis]